jgi:hypothetical protein
MAALQGGGGGGVDYKMITCVPEAASKFTDQQSEGCRLVEAINYVLVRNCFLIIYID